jgi:transposase
MNMTSQRLAPAQMQLLERQLMQTDDVRLYRRTLALLMWARGSAVAEIASLLQVHRQSVYNWIASYTQSCDPSRLGDRERSGRPPIWTEQIEALLAELIAVPPDQKGYLAVNWTVPLLQEQLEREKGVHFSDDTIRRALHHLGYVWKRYRYVLDPDPELEKKTAHSWQNPDLRTTQCVAGTR